MSKLTCKGFLKRYLQELSLQNTSAVTKLVKEVDDNLRLLEPLSLYCVLTLTDEQIQRLNSQIVSKQIEYLKQFDNIENALSNKKLTRDYQKVYHSFECENKKQEVDNTIKALIVNRTQELKKEKCISNYKIYTSLGLNAGNANAFLSKGDVSKLSLANANRILTFTEAY